MFGLSTELITKGKLATDPKEIRVLTFRALSLRQSESNIRSDEGLMSAFESL